MLCICKAMDNPLTPRSSTLVKPSQPPSAGIYSVSVFSVVFFMSACCVNPIFQPHIFVGCTRHKGDMNLKCPKKHSLSQTLSAPQICCDELQTVMVPLPDCASGEWGPTKATRLFGLVPITHQVSNIINLKKKPNGARFF